MPSAADQVIDVNTAEQVWTAPRELVLVRGDATTRSPSAAGRRSLNVAVAAISLVILAPVMALIALLIKLTSPGPVIYRQSRVGLDRRRPGVVDGRRKVDYGGRLFTMYKFRTMRESSTADQVWARPDDDRVTSIGRVLRKYRLDELPQLWNVLKGDMNVVGPRPEQPTIFAELREKVQHYPIRQRVLPGITGWAQVNQSYDRCIDDVRNKVRYDLQYLERSSVSEDLKILALTVPVMVMRKGGW
ncbi:MAG TPA: sugar transferase [Longimicrobiales bacterium]|nr:sugar transferase [Longimicrobiales bacterium]